MFRQTDFLKIFLLFLSFQLIFKYDVNKLRVLFWKFRRNSQWNYARNFSLVMKMIFQKAEDLPNPHTMLIQEKYALNWLFTNSQIYLKPERRLKLQRNHKSDLL